MIAVGGFAKAFPPQPTGYDFKFAGSMETRFEATTWLQSDNRVRWRWNDEALFTDLDGSFADQPFCAGCHVLQNGLVSNPLAFPDCYQDARYGGTVCKPNYHIVEAGFIPADPLMVIKSVRLSNRGTGGDGSGLFVQPTDTVYLRDKWRPAGAHNLVQMDVSTDVLRPTIVGESDQDWFGSWDKSEGTWVGPRLAHFKIEYTDQYDDHKRTAYHYAEISHDGSQLTWINGTSRLNGTYQARTHGSHSALSPGAHTVPALPTACCALFSPRRVHCVCCRR